MNNDETYSCSNSVACPTATQSKQSKFVSLSPSNTVNEGVAVTLNPSDINKDTFVNNNNEWQMQITDSSIGAYGWGLEISLDNTWAFDGDVESILTMTIYGTSFVDKTISDLIIAFSVDDSKYFTAKFPMDNKSPNLIGPSCNSPILSFGNVKQNVETIKRTSLGSGSWQPDENGGNYWPLNIVLQYKPENVVKVLYTGNILDSISSITGNYIESFDCTREEGGGWFGGVDYNHCFRKDEWLIWNTGCGWEIGRHEMFIFYDDYTHWQRYARYYTGQCSEIPETGLTTEALTTNTFYDGFGALISNLTSCLVAANGATTSVCSIPAWTDVLTLGEGGNVYEEIMIDVGEDTFNAIFRNSGDEPIIRRQCSNCIGGFTDIYYRRLGNRDTFNAYSNMKVTWTDVNNHIGIDFNLYSSLQDALTNTNAWEACNYNDYTNSIGAFRDCGPTQTIANQWTANNKGKNSKFSIYTPLNAYTPITVKQYGIKIAPNSISTSMLSVTLLYDCMVYQCNLTPNVIDELSCDGSSTLVESSNCEAFVGKNMILIENTDYILMGESASSPINIDYVFVETLNGIKYQVDTDLCLNMNHCDSNTAQIDLETREITTAESSFNLAYDCIVNKTNRISRFLCNEEKECKNGDYQCNENRDCNILCSSYNACFQAHFKCPANANCVVQVLSGAGVAKYISIDASNTVSGSLSVELYSTVKTNAMSFAKIYCPAFGDCFINLSHIQSFVSRTLSNSLIIAQKTTNSLSITGTGYCILCDTQIYCPVNNCDISVSGSYRAQLENAEFYVYDGSNSLSIHASITSAQGIDDYPCSFKILSNDYPINKMIIVGKYFNFDQSVVDCMLGYEYLSGSVNNVFYSETNQVTTTKIWRGAHTTDPLSTGQGRKNPSGNANNGDWKVGESVSFEGSNFINIACASKTDDGSGCNVLGSKNPPRCWFEILSNDHGDRIGKYFNFDRSTVDCILGYEYPTSTIWTVIYSKTMEIRTIRMWRGAYTDNTPADGQGRQEPSSEANDGDWEPGEFIAFIGLDDDIACGRLTELDGCINHRNIPKQICRNDVNQTCGITMNNDETYSCSNSVACPTATQSKQSKFVSLSPSNTVNEGVAVTLNPSDINKDTFVNNNNEWQMQITDSSIGAYGWGLEISLDNTWAFDGDVESILTMTIYGTSFVDKTISDLIIAFSVDDSKYFTAKFPMDNKSPNLIGPSCNSPILSFGNVKQNVETIKRTSLGSGSWQPDENGGNYWPLNIVLQYKPENVVKVLYTGNILDSISSITGNYIESF
eukprot:229577_1